MNSSKDITYLWPQPNGTKQVFLSLQLPWTQSFWGTSDMYQNLLFFYLPRYVLHKLKGLWNDGMRQDCNHFMTRLYETGLHPFLWQDGMRQDCIHFYDKMVWDRTAFILWQDCMRQDCIHFFWQDGMRQDCIHFCQTWWHETGLYPFLWQDCMRQDCVHFFDKPAKYRYSSILHSYVYTHIYTSQKECLCIFPWDPVVSNDRAPSNASLDLQCWPCMVMYAPTLTWPSQNSCSSRCHCPGAV